MPWAEYTWQACYTSNAYRKVCIMMTMRLCDVETNYWEIQVVMYPLVCTYRKLHRSKKKQKSFPGIYQTIIQSSQAQNYRKYDNNGWYFHVDDNETISTNISTRSPKFKWISWTHTAQYIVKKVKKVVEITNYILCLRVLEGFVVTMHWGVCEKGSQIPRALARGIWRTVCTSPSALWQQTPTVWS